MSFFVLIPKILTLGILSFLALTISGYGLTQLLLPQHYRSHSFMVMPLVGYAFLVSLATCLSWAGLGTKDYFWGLLLLALLISLSVLLLTKDKRPIVFFPAELICPLIVALIVFLIGLVPLMVRGHLTVIGYNGDAVFTSLLVNYLEDHSIAAPLVSFEHPYTVQTWFLNSGYWLGFILFQALIDQVFQLEAHQSFSLLTALFLSFIPLTLCFFCRCLLGVGISLSRLILLLSAINSTLFWLHYDDFAANIVGINLILLAVSLLFFVMEEYNLRTALLAALILSAFLNTYPWMLSYILGPTGIYLIYLWRYQKKSLSALIKTLCQTTMLALCLNPLVIMRLIKQLTWLTRLPKAFLGGNITEFISLAELYGLSHHRVLDEGWYLSPYFQAIILLTLIASVGVTFYGLIATSGKLRALLISLAFPPIINFFYLKYVVGYPYGFFKNISMSITITTILLATGIFSLYELKKGRTGPQSTRSRIISFLPGLPLAFMAVYILINIYTLITLTKETSKIMTLNLSSMEDLSTKVKSLNISGPIYLKDDKETRMLWLIYFLKNQPLILNNLSPFIYYEMYPLAKPKDFYQDGISQDYVLIRRKQDILPPWTDKVIYENEEYQLLKKKPEVLYHLDLNPQPLLLHNRDSLTISTQSEELVINSQGYSLPQELLGHGQNLIFKLFVPQGASYLWEQGQIRETIRAEQNIKEIMSQIKKRPFHIEITNLSRRTLILPWLEITGKKKSEMRLDTIFDYFPELLLPDTDFFVLAGWYDLDLSNEKVKGRWGGGSAISLFKNPNKKSLLKIKGQISHWAIEEEKMPQIQIFLNGFQLDNFIPQDKEFVRNLILDTSLLGDSQWCELTFVIDKTIVPRQFEHSGDKRELGIKITQINLYDYFTPPEKVLPDPSAELYLITGWHELEYGDRIAGTHPRRWTKGQALSLLKNPGQEGILELAGTLPPISFPSPPIVRIMLQGKEIDRFVPASKEFYREIPITNDLLVNSPWLELIFSISQTFIPDTHYKTGDRRELGICITMANVKKSTWRSRISEPIIDFGKPEAHKRLLKGWSWDETWPNGNDFSWSNDMESLLTIDIPKISNYVMNMKMIPFRRPSDSPQQMKIYINGHFLAELRLINDQWLDYQVFIPFDYLSRLGTNSFRFLYKYLGSVPGDNRSLAVAFDRIRFNKAGPQRILPDSGLYIGHGWYEIERDPKTGIYWRKANNGAEFWLKKPSEPTSLSIKGKLISYPEKGPGLVQLRKGKKELGSIKTADRTFAGKVRIPPNFFPDSNWLKLNISTAQAQRRETFKITELRSHEKVLPNSPAQVISGWSELEIDSEKKEFWRWTEDMAETYLPGSIEEGYWQILGEILPLEAYTNPPQIKIGLNNTGGDSFVSLTPHFLWQHPVQEEPTKLRLSIDQTVIPDSYYHNGDRRRVGLKIKRLGIYANQGQPPDLLIDLGEKIARENLKSGWSWDEQWDNTTSFVWATAKESSLQFPVLQKANYFLNLRLMPFTFPGAPKQTIKVYLNGNFLAEIPSVKPAWQIYQLFIRAKYLSGRGSNTLQLVHSYTQIPSEVLGSEDHRNLAAAYDYISLIPSPSITKPSMFSWLKGKFLYPWTR